MATSHVKTLFTAHNNFPEQEDEEAALPPYAGLQRGEESGRTADDADTVPQAAATDT